MKNWGQSEKGCTSLKTVAGGNQESAPIVKMNAGQIKEKLRRAILKVTLKNSPNVVLGSRLSYFQKLRHAHFL